MSYTQIAESERSDSLLTSGNKIGLEQKSLQIQAKSCDFILNPACVEICPEKERSGVETNVFIYMNNLFAAH